MAHYGKKFDEDYDPVKEQKQEDVYRIFTNFFHNPKMHKVKETGSSESGKYAIYMIKVDSLLSREYRYLIAIIPDDSYYVGSVRSLNELKWISFQTRKLSENYKIESHPHIGRRTTPLDAEINTKDRNEQTTSHTCKDLPSKR